MDVLFWILLALTSPFFYILGIITFVRWLSRHSHLQTPAGPNANPVTGRSTPPNVAPLREYASHQSAKIATALNKIADDLESGQRAPSKSGSVEANVPAKTAPVPPPAASRWSSLSVDDAMHRLDNINVLLYLGAFLVVVSAGIFVGYNFETLTGGFKTAFLGLFAAVFYGVGLTLFLRSQKLRPAGVTFTGIGLVLLPLVGLAAYNFTSLHDFGHATWFVTSIITLAAYLATLLVTRQTYIAYLMAFTTLSLFESSISLFDVPVYWFGWGMAITSIVLLAVSGTKRLWNEANSALLLSANVFVPVSIVLSLAAMGDDGLSQLGVTIALAGVFYGAMAWRFHERSAGEVYFAAALISLPAALGFGFWTSLTRGQIAIIMLVVCIAYWVVEHLPQLTLKHEWHELLASVTGLLPLAGIAVIYDHPGAITLILLGAAVLNGELAWRQRQSGLALLAIISLLAVPLVFGRFYLSPVLGWDVIAALMLAEVPVLVWWRHNLRGWPEAGDAVGVLGYLMAQILALFYAAVAGSTPLLLVSLAVTALLYGLSWYERAPKFIYGAASALYLSIIQLTLLGNLDRAVDVVLMLAAGVIVYCCGWFEVSGGARATPLRVSGLVGPFLGAVVGLGLDGYHLEPAVALAAAGGLLIAEAHRRRNTRGIEEWGAAVLVLAFNWACGILQVSQLQAYTLPWAIYFAALAFRRRHQARATYDGFTGLALAILTIPLAGQALGDDGQGYGLILILESLALVFVGLGISYRLITWWGVVGLVLEVLYQLRDVFYALPKYVISAALGLALLAVAIVLLQRRRGND